MILIFQIRHSAGMNRLSIIQLFTNCQSMVGESRFFNTNFIKIFYIDLFLYF